MCHLPFYNETWTFFTWNLLVFFFLMSICDEKWQYSPQNVSGDSKLWDYTKKISREKSWPHFLSTPLIQFMQTPPGLAQTHLAQWYSRRIALMLYGAHESEIYFEVQTWCELDGSLEGEMIPHLLNRLSHWGAKFSIITGCLYEIGSR